MALIQSPADCCLPCDEPVVTNIPGPQGAAGAAGADGADGVNAYTATTAAFTMPAEGADVTVDVGVSSWMTPGQKVYVGMALSAARGTFEVASVPDATHAVLTNVEDTAAGEYEDNSAPGTVFPVGSAVGPSGLQGPAGAAGAGGAPVAATYITQTPHVDLTNEQALSVLATGLMKNTTATGVVSVVPLGVADTNVAPVDAAAGLVAGDAMFATAGGQETKTAADARTALGLGTMAVQNANNVAITGGTITGVNLGLSGVPKDFLIFENRQAVGVGGGDFSQGAWRTVPLNTEVVDTGGDGVLAANEVTLTQGTYRARWRVPAYEVALFQSRLFNVTSAAVVAYGSNSVSILDTMPVSIGESRFTVVAATETVRLEAQCSLTQLGTGFGEPNSFGGTEVYAALVLEKEEA